MNTPEPKVLPGTDIIAPHLFLGDEGFPMLDNLLKPYPRNQSINDRKKAIFNYRLSRARRIVENAFGILAHRFRILLTPIHSSVDVIEDIITVACTLHNLIIDEKGISSDANDLPSDDFEPMTEYNEIEADSGQELKYKIRDTFRDYFNSIGSVSWQNESFRL